VKLMKNIIYLALALMAIFVSAGLSILPHCIITATGYINSQSVCLKWKYGNLFIVSVISSFIGMGLLCVWGYKEEYRK
jgi:hypothetical protein